ncbi:MAG: DUF4296 domain-containing protein [Cyclobacteriaceae bacterium]
MKYLPILTIFIFILFSCSGDKPENLIDKDKMTRILIEMHIAEAKVNSLGLTSDSTEVLVNMMTEKVLQENGLTEQDYLESYTYYLQDVRVMENLYGRVVDSLSLREEISNNSFK